MKRGEVNIRPGSTRPALTALPEALRTDETLDGTRYRQCREPLSVKKRRGAKKQFRHLTGSKPTGARAVIGMVCLKEQNLTLEASDALRHVDRTDPDHVEGH